ncbi:MAG TPA: AMP-binding protein, partial [Longimicrobiaceae bacterium]|nr:AMP-binding protein [Longimicrobiaceae bacterium]
MSYSPTTLLRLVQDGIPKNGTGVHSATKRDGRWTETSPEQFSAAVQHLAMGLRALGVARGDRVALHAENCTEWLVADQ